jgi:hypothetical protein
VLKLARKFVVPAINVVGMLFELVRSEQMTSIAVSQAVFVHLVPLMATRGKAMIPTTMCINIQLVASQAKPMSSLPDTLPALNKLAITVQVMYTQLNGTNTYLRAGSWRRLLQTI